jgi:hypothetical protein
MWRRSWTFSFVSVARSLSFMSKIFPRRRWQPLVTAVRFQRLITAVHIQYRCGAFSWPGQPPGAAASGGASDRDSDVAPSPNQLGPVAIAKRLGIARSSVYRALA